MTTCVLRRRSILTLRSFGGRNECCGVSEKVHTDATVFRRRLILMLCLFGEGQYVTAFRRRSIRYGVSEKVHTHATLFRRRLIIMLRRFGGQFSRYGVSEKVHTDATVFRNRLILTLRRFGEGPY